MNKQQEAAKRHLWTAARKYLPTGQLLQACAYCGTFRQDGNDLLVCDRHHAARQEVGSEALIETPTILHCEMQLEKDSWIYRIKRADEKPNCNDVVLVDEVHLLTNHGDVCECCSYTQKRIAKELRAIGKTDAGSCYADYSQAIDEYIEQLEREDK